MRIRAGDRHDPRVDRVFGIKAGLRHLAIAAVVALSACTTPQLQEYGAQPDGVSRAASPPQRPIWSSLIAPATNKPATSEFVSRGSGQFIGAGDAVVPAKTFKGSDGVTINLLNAPVAQAAKTILGDILKADYTISDKVTGTVTIQTSAPVDPAALADIFEAVLKSNGIALVQADGHYRLAPLATASTAPVSLGGAHGAGITTRIIPLKYVAAGEMRRVAEPMFGQGTILRADDQRNLLVVNGTGSELANLERLVEAFDVDWMRQMSFGVFPVKSAEPDVIAKELETVFGLDKDGPLKGVVKIMPNPPLNAVLVISSRPEYLDTARTWIERYLTMGEGKEEQIYAYRVQNRPAPEVADVLQKILATDGSGSGGSVAPRLEPTTTTSAAHTGTGLATSTSATGLGGGLSSAGLGSGLGGAGLGSGLGGGGTGSTFRAAPSSSTATTASSYRTPTAKVTVDESMHTLVIQTIPSEYQRILRILRRLDVAGTEVMIEVSVVEVDLTDELRQGVQFHYQSGEFGLTLSNAGSGALASTFPGFSAVMSASKFNVIIDDLSSKTKVNVLSTPNVTVMDNKTASIQVGDQIPIQTATSQSTIASNAPILNSIQMVDTGVILSVTPHVNDSGRIELDLEQEVSNATPTTSSTIQSPTIQQRRVKTAIALSDGEMVVLGGLIQERNNVTRTSIPLLGDVTAIGNLVGTKDDQITRTELLMLIRPHIVRDGDDARRATEEYRSRIKAETPRSKMGRTIIQRDINRTLN